MCCTQATLEAFGIIGDVPFYAKARKGLGCVEIYSETGCNLHAYADQISETFGLRGIQAYGLPNYLTVPLYV